MRRSSAASAMTDKPVPTLARRGYLFGIVALGLIVLLIAGYGVSLFMSVFAYNEGHEAKQDQQSSEKSTAREISKLKLEIAQLKQEIKDIKTANCSTFAPCFVNQTTFNALVQEVRVVEQNVTSVNATLTADVASIEATIETLATEEALEALSETVAMQETQIQILNETIRGIVEQGITAYNYGSAGSDVYFSSPFNDTGDGLGLVFARVASADCNVSGTYQQFGLVPYPIVDAPVCNTTQQPLVRIEDVEVGGGEVYSHLVVCPCVDGYYSVDFSFGPIEASRTYLVNGSLVDYGFTGGLQVDAGLIYVDNNGGPTNATFYEGDWPLPPMVSTTWTPGAIALVNEGTGPDFAIETTYLTLTGGMSAYLRRTVGTADDAACYRFTVVVLDTLQEWICAVGPEDTEYRVEYALGQPFNVPGIRPTTSMFSVQQLGWNSPVPPVS